MISLHYDAAEGSLSKVVSSFYRFDYEGNDLRELERADRAQFRFSLKESGHYEFAAGHTRPSFPVTILAPTSAHVTSVADCPQTIVGWGMHPAGWVTLMGKSGADRTDDAIDASEIFGDSILELREQLIACGQNNQALFALMKDAARELFAETDKAPFEFTAIVDNWLTNNVEHDISELTQSTALSQRQLERVTKRYYGMPPKKLARKYRALRAAQMLSRGDDLENSELGLSFYDQSHLVREIKQFTGLTPSQLKSGEGKLTKATMDGRHGLAGRVDKLVSDS